MATKKTKKAKKAETKSNTPHFTDDQKITLLVKENPRRKKSATYKIFALYRNGMTVGQFLEKGGRRVDVLADVQRKHIRVA